MSLARVYIMYLDIALRMNCLVFECAGLKRLNLSLLIMKSSLKLEQHPV